MNSKFRFVVEPTKDGRLQVRSNYTAGDLAALYVESRLRLLLEMVERDAEATAKE